MTANVSNYFDQPDGAGTDNTLVLGGSVETATGVSLKSLYISVDMTDVSTAGSVWVSPGRACTFKRLVSTIANAITGANAVITTEIGGALVTNGGLTITQSGSAAGDVDVATPTAANTLTASQALEIISDGASSTTCRTTFVAEFELA
jgi:hypothetical protein